jgi:pimeloyl-ACP methyl ester carboxylesterase
MSVPTQPASTSTVGAVPAPRSSPDADRAAIRPFEVRIPDEALTELRHRLAATRLPSRELVDDRSQGVQLAVMRELCRYWANDYDLRRVETRLNALPQFTIEIDGVEIHLVHVRSPHENALPLIMTHGWPGSVMEMIDSIGPLTDPTAHGGSAEDAFHLVLPSRPGYGFSAEPTELGWDLGRTAGAWAELMRRLGYDRYVAQGGDLGSWISVGLAGVDFGHVAGVHLNFLPTPPPPDPAALAGLTEQEFGRLGKLAQFVEDQSAYMKLQSTRPQTIAYGLTDSPVLQLAWIIEKFQEWSDSEKVPEDAISRDKLLTNVAIYWFTATAGSAAQFYFENAAMLPTAPTQPAPPPPLPVPLGVAVFPHDPGQAIRRFAEPFFPNIVHWSEFDRGGHFAALEQPELFVGDLRAFKRALG